MWIYNNNKIEILQDMPEGTLGFIYIITNIQTNQFYVGKKQLHSSRKKKLTKREIAEQTGPGRRATTKRMISESDWLTYTGSSKELNDDIKLLGKDKFSFEILMFCTSKKQMTYNEIKYQILNGCLENQDKTYNRNIAGRYFPGDV